MTHHIDNVILDLLHGIRFRFDGGTVWLKIAEGVIERDENRREALDAMLTQRRFIQSELDNLNAAITLCRQQCKPTDMGGAS
ncbi:MAG: hypothetical protein AAGJ70_11805 [Pseudomonadota bacterium]